MGAFRSLRRGLSGRNHRLESHLEETQIPEGPGTIPDSGGTSMTVWPKQALRGRDRKGRFSPMTDGIRADPGIRHHLGDPITRHMRRDFSRILVNQTVGEALAAIRRQPPEGRV